MKLEPRNVERCSRPPQRSGLQCPHIRRMRTDGRSHDLWIVGYVFEGEKVVMLQCDDCAANTDSLPELDWRLPYKMVSEEEAKHLLRTEPDAEMISEYGKRLQQEVFDEHGTKN